MESVALAVADAPYFKKANYTLPEQVVQLDLRKRYSLFGPAWLMM
jgi:hypothetical protein